MTEQTALTTPRLTQVQRAVTAGAGATAAARWRLAVAAVAAAFRAPWRLRLRAAVRVRRGVHPVRRHARRPRAPDGFRSLHSFKTKFKPRHEPMYLAYRDEADLPRIGIALARAYLPDTSLRSLTRLHSS